MVKHVKNTLNHQSKTKASKPGYYKSKFIEFCKRTDLHGYKYVIMSDLTTFEKSCWGLALILSILTAIQLVILAYKWFARNPIITVIESTQGAIWDIPFPSVTLCNLNHISRKAARTFSRNVTLPVNMTADYVFKILKLAPLLHTTSDYDQYQKQALMDLQKVVNLNSISIEDFFKIISPAFSCNQLLERCMWKNTIYRCEDLFQQIFTLFGVCCTFNFFALNLATDHSESVLKNDPFKLKAPRKVASCGYGTALTVILNIHPEDYYSCGVASKGALVIVDDAYHVPDINSPLRMVNPSTEVLIALSPEWTYSTAGIKAFSPDQTQCYYSDEMKLGKLSQYSYHNCIIHQKIEAVKSACECIPYYFPLKEEHRTCNFRDMDCLLEVYRAQENSTKEYEQYVKCLPECEHYDYPFEMAFGRLVNNLNNKGLSLFKNIDLTNRSLVNVFFNDLVSTKYRRDVYLNWQNILSSFGGLLSLMLGFTLISGFDLILFLTFRMVYDNTNNQNSQKIKSNRINVQEYSKRSLDNTFKNRTLTPTLNLEKWPPTNNRFEKY